MIYFLVRDKNTEAEIIKDHINFFETNMGY